MTKTRGPNGQWMVWVSIVFWSCLPGRHHASAETLSLRSAPDLVVYLDAKPIGRTTGQGDLFEVSPGRHVLQLRGAHLESAPITVTIRKGVPFFLAVPHNDLRDAQHTVSRMPSSGVLVVTSSPQVCEVGLLGRIYKKTEPELTLTGMPVGEHEIQIRIGKAVLSGQVPVRLARKTHLRADFEHGRFEVSEPPKKSLPTLPTQDSGPPLERRRSGAPKPVRVGGGVRAPVKISGTSELGSSNSSRTAHVAIVDVIINEQGHVENRRVVSADGEWTESIARSLVGTWRFKPATRDGQPVAVYWRVRLVRWSF